MEHLYYSDAASRVIKKINKYTGGEPVDVNVKGMSKSAVDIKVVHHLKQPTADSLSSFPGYDWTLFIYSPISKDAESLCHIQFEAESL